MARPNPYLRKSADIRLGTNFGCSCSRSRSSSRYPRRVTSCGSRSLDQLVKSAFSLSTEPLIYHRCEVPSLKDRGCSWSRHSSLNYSTLPRAQIADNIVLLPRSFSLCPSFKYVFYVKLRKRQALRLQLFPHYPLCTSSWGRPGISGFIPLAEIPPASCLFGIYHILNRFLDKRRAERSAWLSRPSFTGRPCRGLRGA